jgi:predicted MFS family arabinose efflux permease
METYAPPGSLLSANLHRLLVRSFVHARGLALGLASCAAPLATVLGAPLLSELMESRGWRAGYIAMAIAAAIFGACALMLIPHSYEDRDVQPERPVVAHDIARDYRALLGNRAFIVIFSALLLCNLHFTMQTTQLALILAEKGVGATISSAMVSVFAVGVIIGRIICGISLDRFPAYLVATVSFLVPGIGLAILSSSSPSLLLAGTAIASLGFSVGAEADIAAFLAARYFRSELFGSILGLFASAMAASAFAGAFLLSWTIEKSGGYALFLHTTSATVCAGSLSFLLLRREVARTS